MEKGGRKKAEYELAAMIKEDHGKSIYGLKMNQTAEGGQQLLATVSVYELPADGGIELLQAYSESDVRDIMTLSNYDDKEEFYTCAWGYDVGTCDPLLAAAGRKGIIRLIRPTKYESHAVLIGHGEAINELKFHPTQPELLLSVSKDHAMRLWHISTCLCVVVLGGENGHRDEVLSADFSLSGEHIVSCGMDHSLKIWNISVPDIQESTENEIICWQPGGEIRLDVSEKISNYLGDPATILFRFKYSDCDIWWVKFCIDATFSTLAVGNRAGKIFIWDLTVANPSSKQNCTVLEAKKCTSIIRQIDISRDARTLVAACDDGTLWRWNR